MREEVEALEHHPDLRTLAAHLTIRQFVDLAAAFPVPHQLAIHRQPASSIFSRWLMQRKNVLLPEPDGPMMHITSPRRDLEVDAAEHLEAAEVLWTACASTIGVAISRSPSSVRFGGDGHVLRQPRRRGVEVEEHSPHSLKRSFRQLAQRAPSEVALQVVLTECEDRCHQQIPDAGHDRQLDDAVIEVRDLLLHEEARRPWR